jgi:aminopeptidase N
MPPKDAAPVIVAPGWQRVSFETTVRMSTYLVAYCITDFVSREATATARNIPVRVWTAPDKIDQVGVALKAAVDALNRYEEFFKVPYPLPKLDNVAIPNFAAGAMENCKRDTTHPAAAAS